MTTSANSLLATVNCEFPLCDQEAATGSTRCRVHGGVKPLGDMDRLRAMYGPDPEHAPTIGKWAAYKRAERALRRAAEDRSGQCLCPHMDGNPERAEFCESCGGPCRDETSA